MKSSIKLLSILIAGTFMSIGVNAAEVYNKDGNKLGLYGKVVGENYISDDHSQNGDQTYVRMGFKGETQVSDAVTGYGQ